MGGVAGERPWYIDALRGLMLVLMTATHLPTRFASPLGQPFGYVSAAEASCCCWGSWRVTSTCSAIRRTARHEMRSAFLKRALKIYAWQVALLLFSVQLHRADRRRPPAGRDRQSAELLLGAAGAAFVNGLFLLYNPPLLDILPMYILFMLTSAPLLLHGVRHGWAPILAASIALWLAAQFDVGTLDLRVAGRGGAS